MPGNRSPLDALWRAAYFPRPIVGRKDVMRRVGRSGFDALIRLRLLVPTQAARSVECPSCEAHGGEVRHAQGYYLWCEQCGLQEVPAEDLLRWEYDYRPLLELIARSLEIRGPTETLVPEKLWKLGRLAVGGRARSLYLGRCLIGCHGRDVRAHLPNGKSSLLLAISRTPEEGLPGIEPERIFPLSSMVVLKDGRFHFDRPVFEAQVAAIEREPEAQPKKRASRATTIDAIKRKLHAHILSMKSMLAEADALGREINLPHLSYEEIGRRIGKGRSAATRAIRDPSDPVLGILWQTARDPDAVRRYSRRI
jgi:hypothetical protein